jgi:hypothetical protein
MPSVIPPSCGHNGGAVRHGRRQRETDSLLHAGCAHPAGALRRVRRLPGKHRDKEYAAGLPAVARHEPGRGDLV